MALSGARLACVAALLASCSATVYLLDNNWRFELNNGAGFTCNNTNATFPIDLDGVECNGLSQANATDLQDCIDACCSASSCETYQWCEPGNACGPANTCWIGAMDGCKPQTGWVSRGRNVSPPSPSKCTDPRCMPGYDDSGWRLLDLPHDFVVEGNFSQTADKSHGYLPFGIGWYRKHLTIPAEADGDTIWLDFDGVQTVSTVWLNGYLLGQHQSGYTGSRYFLNASIINFGADNLLAVEADATNPDGWWYDGGGIYRHVWLTFVNTPGPYIAPWGVYAASSVTGNITWSPQGAPFADAQLNPSVEVWNNASSTQSFTVLLVVIDPSGNTAATATGTGTVAGNGGVTVWQPTQPIALPNAPLWHLVTPPLYPALYRLLTVLSVNSQQVHATNVTFGIRTATFDAATGFHLNGVPTKILGNANHQDFAGVGVAVPDRLQAHRVQKLKDMGANGWRTAHNPPTPALLDAADALGFLVWDENHRNGQADQLPLLVLRDRNHPSVVIWSICNEALCKTSDDCVQEALRMKSIIHALDPLSGRPVSANQNGWVGPNTPLDVQGFDYSTGSYDNWHTEAPNIPSISSETSSAVSDRDEYANDPVSGHVSGYDNNYPGWGESAEQAWGGVGESDNQGILTRPFISGGWTWTGWDYKGEPTPYAWPDINSHFGIIDIAGFPKDRYHWYVSWFAQPSPAHLYLFPHWNWNQGDNVDIWAYSNADEVELFVNGVSVGRKPMTQYSHVEWDAVPWVPGWIQAVAYVNNVAVNSVRRNTTGPAAALQISIKDNFGTTMLAGCNDVALVQVAIVDTNGDRVPTASDNVTFTVSGPATLAGTGNGDPACHTPDKSPTRPAFHGYVLAVIQGGADAGVVTVKASAPGFDAVTLQIQQLSPQPGYSSYWCHLNPTL